jgi:Rieske Fe-S protein
MRATDVAAQEVSRRSVLEGAGVAVAAGVVGYAGFAALGPDPGADGDDQYGTGPGSDGAGDDVDSHHLAAVDDIPDGGGIVIADEKLVLTRDGDTVRGFSAVCTHQGCLVGGVRDGEIRCPCHGSAFDAATGAVVQGPATEPLEAEDIEVTDRGEVLRA